MTHRLLALSALSLVVACGARAVVREGDPGRLGADAGASLDDAGAGELGADAGESQDAAGGLGADAGGSQDAAAGPGAGVFWEEKFETLLKDSGWVAFCPDADNCNPQKPGFASTNMRDHWYCPADASRGSLQRLLYSRQ